MFYLVFFGLIFRDVYLHKAKTLIFRKLSLCNFAFYAVFRLNSINKTRVNA